MDHVVRLARLRIIKASADIEQALRDKANGGPFIEMLHRLYDRAGESLAALAFVDAEKPAEVRAFQNEVKRYDEWVVWMREILSQGRAYAQEIDATEREELIDILTQTDEGQAEAEALGLIDSIPRDA